MHSWLVAAVFAQALDATATCANLQRSGVREINPLLGQSCVRVVGTKLLVSMPLLSHKLRHSTVGKVLIGSLIVAGTVGVISNAQVAKSHKR